MDKMKLVAYGSNDRMAALASKLDYKGVEKEIEDVGGSDQIITIYGTFENVKAILKDLLPFIHSNNITCTLYFSTDKEVRSLSYIDGETDFDKSGLEAGYAEYVSRKIEHISRADQKKYRKPMQMESQDECPGCRKNPGVSKPYCGWCGQRLGRKIYLW